MIMWINTTNTNKRISVEKTTKEIYINKLSTILKKSNLDKDEFFNLAQKNPNKIRRIFMSSMSGLSKNSYPIYRQSVYHFLDSIAVDRELYDISGFAVDAERRKSSNKKKNYPQKVRAAVIDKILEKKRIGVVDQFIRLHLIVGPYTGNRLIEYLALRAYAVEDGLEIVIQNGKRNELRANGVERKYTICRSVKMPDSDEDVDLLGAIHEIQDLLKERVGLISEFDGSDEVIQKKKEMLNFLRVANHSHNKLLKGIVAKGRMQPKLSSTRHQFKIGLSESTGSVGIAAAMGHSSTETHGRNYGTKRGGLLVSDNEQDVYRAISPSDESMEKVRTPSRVNILTR